MMLVLSSSSSSRQPLILLSRQLLLLLIYCSSAELQYSRNNRGPNPARNDDSQVESWEGVSSPRDEVGRLLREYKQNQEMMRGVEGMYYQVVYPMQVRQDEKIGISTREIDTSYPPKGRGRGFNDPDPGPNPDPDPIYQPRVSKAYISGVSSK
jgi:hypothetical protein